MHEPTFGLASNNICGFHMAVGEKDNDVAPLARLHDLADLSPQIAVLTLWLAIAGRVPAVKDCFVIGNVDEEIGCPPKGTEENEQLATRNRLLEPWQDP
jgi:hypothetical protein